MLFLIFNLVNSESENEKFAKKKTLTFCGKSFMSAVTSQVLQQREPRLVIFLQSIYLLFILKTND